MIVAERKSALLTRSNIYSPVLYCFFIFVCSRLCSNLCSTFMCLSRTSYFADYTWKQNSESASLQKKKTCHRPGSCARQDGGGVLTAPISIRARSSCIVLDALRARPPDVRKHQRLWPIGGACWPHGSRYCCSGSVVRSAGKRGPIPVF